MRRYFVHCENCKKWKVWIKMKGIYIPQLRIEAMPKKLLCAKCLKVVQQAIQPNGK